MPRFEHPFGREFSDEDSYSSNDGPYIQERPAPKVYASTKDIDLDKALADQFAEAESFRDHLLNNSEAYQPNHVTGAITSLNRIIEQIVKLREEVINQARMQVFEATVIEVMKAQPESVRADFFSTLELKLAEVK